MLISMEKRSQVCLNRNGLNGLLPCECETDPRDCDTEGCFPCTVPMCNLCSFATSTKKKQGRESEMVGFKTLVFVCFGHYWLAKGHISTHVGTRWWKFRLFSKRRCLMFLSLSDQNFSLQPVALKEIMANRANAKENWAMAWFIVFKQIKKGALWSPCT